VVLGIGLLAVAGVLAVRGASTASAEGPSLRTPGVAVDCEPTQRALVRQEAGGDERVVVQCVSDPYARAVAPAADLVRPAAPVAVPAIYTVAPASTAAAPRATTARRASRSSASATAKTSERSWKKTALVIGGSAGAGAGVGAIVAGGKGAAIGAAIGGGAATLYEAIKR
jgi:hypothetical protein